MGKANLIDFFRKKGLCTAKLIIAERMIFGFCHMLHILIFPFWY